MVLIKEFIINLCQRLARAVLIRLAEDVELMQAIQAGVSSATLVNKEFGGVEAVPDRERLLVKALQRVPPDGMVCEFGVYKGHTLQIIANVLKDRIVYGFDSFEGLPEVWRSGFGKGTFKVDAADIPEFPKNVTLYPGQFDTTLPRMLQEDSRRAAFLHIDCDLYSSAKYVFDLVSRRLRPGTIIVFDEYFNFPGWEHDEHRALIEAARNAGFTYEYIFYNPKGQQVAIVVTGVREK